MNPFLAGCVAAGAFGSVALPLVLLSPNHSLHRTRPRRRASEALVGRAGELRIRQTTVELVLRDRFDLPLTPAEIAARLQPAVVEKADWLFGPRTGELFVGTASEWRAELHPYKRGRAVGPLPDISINFAESNGVTAVTVAITPPLWPFFTSAFVFVYVLYLATRGQVPSLVGLIVASVFIPVILLLITWFKLREARSLVRKTIQGSNARGTVV